MIAAVSPQRTSAIENIALSAAITTSHAAMMPVPPPKQPPCTSATVGTGAALSRRTASAVAPDTRMFSSAEAVRTASIQPRSAPAWKCRPLPVMTTARKASTCASASSAASRLSISAPS